MGYGRTDFSRADCPKFSVELPPGLVFTELSDVDLRPFSFAEPLVAIVAVNGPAQIILSIVSAKGASSLTHVVRRCANERGSSNPSLFFENFGGEVQRHPGLLAEISTGCEFGLFEDGGRVLVMEASGEADIWPDYEPFLQRAMLSVELLEPLGPTLPLSPNEKVPELQPGAPDPEAVAASAHQAALQKRCAEAEKLIRAGRFQEAEELVVGREADAAIFGRMGRLYEEYLREDGQQSKSTREEVFRRALDWKLRSYPDPHTEIEAEDYARGMAEDRHLLIKLLEYDPQ